MNQRADNYQSYLIRLWQEESNGVRVWRASLESVQTRERHSFTGLPALYRFLMQQVALSHPNRKDVYDNDAQNHPPDLPEASL